MYLSRSKWSEGCLLWERLSRHLLYSLLVYVQIKSSSAQVWGRDGRILLLIFQFFSLITSFFFNTKICTCIMYYYGYFIVSFTSIEMQQCWCIDCLDSHQVICYHKWHVEDRLRATQRWGAARCKVFCEVFVVISGQDGMGDREKGAVNIPTRYRG